jgi:hypothetical protein
VKGERLVQYAVALGIVAVWLFLVIVDSRSDTYSVPKEVSAVAFFAVGFFLGFDKLVSLVQAWRRTSPPGRESEQE